MSALTPTRTAPGSGASASGTRRGVLHGMTWLVWRRHRAALWTAIVVTVVACAYFVYQRFGLMDFLDTHQVGRSSRPGSDVLTKFDEEYAPFFRGATTLLTYFPFVAAVFLGAPLIAHEQEHGTVKLATTQSADRGRWIAVKLGLPLLVLLACTTLLSVTFTWLWMPARALVSNGNWLESDLFDATGPMPVALSLLLTVLGIGSGVVLRRTLPAMAITFVAANIVSMAWSMIQKSLAPLRHLSYPLNGDFPDMPATDVQMDQWVATADGRLFGIGTCVNETNPDACYAQKGIVNRVVDYLSFDQMAGMQWIGAGFMLAATAVLIGLIVWRTRRRPL
ncbi:ABC transporter permease subunit [Streptomyces sp. NPDC003077]|uniref:ABC transporter permease subunit n=1 Tax=Streptomyces sp. NPDC003077 TaxID=3154443 RepID=UPI0033ACD1DC